MLLTTLLAQVEGDVVDAGKALGLALGMGLGSLGAGIGIGTVFASMIQSVARQPELRGELQGIMWLGFALTEAVVFYGLVGGFLGLVLVQMQPLLAVLAVAAEEENGGSPLTEIIPGLMIWTIIVFGATLFVLWKFAFGPIQKTIDERRRRIREALEEADYTRTEARRLLEEHRELRARARGEAEDILNEARRVADSMRERVREETDADRARRLEETRRQVEAETERALEQIRAEIAGLALVAAEKVTRGALGRPEQRRLIDEAIGELDFSVLERQGRS